MDGRYETTYPESTFELNSRFYEKRGTNWDQLIRDYPVDYVILDYLEEPLRPQDLVARGYVFIWQTGAIPRCWPCRNSPASSSRLPPTCRHHHQSARRQNSRRVVAALKSTNPFGAFHR